MDWSESEKSNQALRREEWRVPCQHGEAMRVEKEGLCGERNYLGGIENRGGRSWSGVSQWLR